ncbi:MAG: hypothetical protein VYE81_11255, partial [Planctomycetota bacterium]|nr:hypothetical protein [Planctomycetota bacterium]
MRPRRASRPVRLACLAATLGLLASCSAEEAGSLELVFHWPDGAPDWSEQRFSVWGRMERWPGGEQTGATIVGEATGPEGAAYALLGPEGAEALSFSRVAHETTLGVVIAVRSLADGATPSAGDDLIYYGASEPFRLEPDAHVTVTVPLGLQPAPGATAVSPEGEAGAGGGAVWICPPDTVTHDPATDCAITHINTGEVTVYVQAPHASQATLANDLSLSKGRRVLEIRDTTAFEEVGEDLFRLIAPWDLNEGLGDGDGSRSVYLQLQNEVGLAANTIERSVVLDTTPPEVNGVAIAVTSPEAFPARETELLTRGSTLRATLVTTEVLPILTAAGLEGPAAKARLINRDGLDVGFEMTTAPESDISFTATYTVPLEG